MQNLTTVYNSDWDNKTLWIAQILNKDNQEIITVYQNDTPTNNSWIQLRSFIQSNKNYNIVCLGLRRGINYIWLPPNKKSYYFINGMVGVLYQSSLEYKILGYEDNGVINCVWYTAIDLLPVKMETRNLDSNSSSLITNV